MAVPGDTRYRVRLSVPRSGGWAGDFAILAQCHSLGGNCGLNDQQPVGNATFAWNLKPTYKKKT